MNEPRLDKESYPQEQPGDLREYLKLRLDLAAIIRSIMELFQQAKDSREHRARLLLSHLAEDRFNLMVVGQFKRGKSSLMNAVIGMDRLPTGILPLTSVVTTVRYGDEESVLVRTKGSSLPEEIPLHKLEEYVTERGNPGNRKHVAAAEVFLPSEILRLGFHFIDTPGVGSSIVENSATTHQFLPEADAVIFVTSFESTMNEGELAFLRAVAGHVHKIFFVVNKLDLVTPEESEVVIASLRQTISAQLGVSDPRVFAVSARVGLEAKRSGNRDTLALSRLPELESALTHFLTKEREEVLLLRCVERAMALLTIERVKNRGGRLGAGFSGDTLRRMKHEWEVKTRQIEADCAHVAKGLSRHIRSELPLHFQQAIAEHCVEVRDKLAAQIDLFLARPGESVTARDLRELTGRSGGIADDLRCRWLSDHHDEFVHALSTLAAEDVDHLGHLYDKTLDFAAGLFGMPPFEKWLPGKDEVRFSWRTAIPFDCHPRFAWELDLLPVRWVRKKVRREYDQALDVATAAYREDVTQGLAEAGGFWADSLGSQMQGALKELLARVGVLLSGREPSALSDQIGLLFDGLERMRLELTDKGDNRGPVLSPILDRGRVVRRCLVCERIETELFDFFSKLQYELSVNGTEQREHINRGGFCPLHTWQYARIASPHGVSLAYAPLLAAVAHGLRGIALSASSASSMREGISHLLASTENCPACRRTAEVEEMALKEFREMSFNRDDEDADTGLCMLHLAAVLGRETDPEAARNLVLDEARALERISENMQTYALKHDALRRELTSDEEARAYLLGLSLLVGLRTLS